MIEKSWLMCPCEFPITNQSSFFEYVEISEVQKYVTDNIFSLDKMSSFTIAITVLEALSGVSRIISIVTHYPIVSFWYGKDVLFY